MKKSFLILALLAALLISCNSEKSSSTEVPDYDSSSVPTLPVEPKPFKDISATELVAEIKIGWNLGNTLDANPNETAWGNPLTKKSNIEAIKAAGFNAVRIPVSWSHHVDKDYNINASFMNRVKEIVGYAADNDMYILLNTHHDEGIFKFQNKDIAKSKAVFKKIWWQIAENFKNENEKLIFEGLNEPRTIGSQAEWSGGTKEERDNLNEMEQIFVDAVRSRGSNNTKRILIVSTYAASAEQSAMSAVKIPNDPYNQSNPAVKKIIVSVHAYSPWNFAGDEGSGKVNTWSKNNSSDISSVNTPLDRAYNTFVSKGIPVIIGEFGAINRNNDANNAARVEWTEYYVTYAKTKGIPCFWWDDGGNFKLLNRGTNTFYFPTIKDALIKGSN